LATQVRLYTGGFELTADQKETFRAQLDANREQLRHRIQELRRVGYYGEATALEETMRGFRVIN
jgi:hypothetical protein